MRTGSCGLVFALTWTGKAVLFLLLAALSHPIRLVPFRRYYLIVCTLSMESGGGFHGDDGSGILENHAYSILCVKEIGALKFVKVRNPWGRGEWLGEWSDGSPKWEEHPEVEAAMREDPRVAFDRDTSDGTFWIVWQDFVKHFNKLYVCRLFGEEFNQYLIQGEWVGKAAGGAHKSDANAGRMLPQLALSIHPSLDIASSFCAAIFVLSWLLPLYLLLLPPPTLHSDWLLRWLG